MFTGIGIRNPHMRIGGDRNYLGCLVSRSGESLKLSLCSVFSSLNMAVGRLNTY